jgi:hypothetical protein
VTQALEPGSRLGSYEVIDRLGQGGMGEVYRARDTRLGRTVALKVLRSGADPELLHRLDREARAASALNHPNIVHIYDVGVAAGETGAHYVVMEHVEGETLRRRVSRGPLPIPEAITLGAQLADGLAKAHRAGILHRDLKPENVMITPEGVLKILDFGLAKLLPAPLAEIDAGETMSRHETQAGTLLGTLEYMSPEQAKGGAVDHRTDQFAVGLLLHEMVTGRPVFRRETAAQVLAAVIERDAEPLSHLRAEVPGALEALVARCLQKDPERRFAKTDELAAELAGMTGLSRSGSQSAFVAAPAPATAAVSVEVMPKPTPAVSGTYHVQAGEKVHTYSEEKLSELLQRGKLTGAELARRDDEDVWHPLFESRIYGRVVPNEGDPRHAARLRLLRGVGGHFTGFFITSVVIFATQGHFPFWLGIWGAVLGMQVLGSVPTALAVLRRNREAAALPAAAAPVPLPPAESPAPRDLASAGVPPVIAEEGARVRKLLEQRGGKNAPNLAAEVDRILKLTAELTARQQDLEEQTTEKERAALATAIADATARLDRAELPQDRRLFERQLEVLQGRQEGIAKAMIVLERLRARRDLAEHQLKQLRLDLTRGAASGLDVPELSSRLEFIRYEVDAREEVEDLRGGRG